jgi:hypothetical protein
MGFLEFFWVKIRGPRGIQNGETMVDFGVFCKILRGDLLQQEIW